MTIVDSHCHLFEMKGYALPQDIIPVLVGFSHSSNMKAKGMAEEKGYPFVLGIAPQTVVRHDRTTLGRDMEEWIGFIRESRPNAIGEVGLDYKWARTGEDVRIEEEVFHRMIALSEELDVPLVIHSRNNPIKNEVPEDAIGRILDLLEGKRFLLHFFSGTHEQAARAVAMGGYISISHLHSKERRRTIEETPIDRLMVESDAPYVGKTPEAIREAITYISEVKGIDEGEVGRKTAENAFRFFGFGGRR